MKVRYIGKRDTLAIDKQKLYDVISIEKGWYRIMTDIGEDYIFPPNVFEIVEGSVKEYAQQLNTVSVIPGTNQQKQRDFVGWYKTNNE